MEVLDEKSEWNSYLEGYFPQYNDTYFRYEYFDIFQRNYGLKPEGIFWNDDHICIFFPHLIRSLSPLTGGAGHHLFDLTTPYGYGGPLLVSKTRERDDLLRSLFRFRDDYFAYAREKNYVSEFIRFHPMFEMWRHFNQIFDLQYLSDTVVVDLTKSPEALRDQLSKNTRRYVTKSQKEFPSMKTVQQPSDAEMDLFFSLYYKTMEHQHVSRKYFFSEGFIRDHFSLLNSCFISCQNSLGETGSIALFFRGDKIFHYHLGATNYRFRTSPLRAVIWESILLARKIGCTHLHLGGGRGRDDSLFTFKTGFSRETHPFYIGKIIFREKEYRDLVQANAQAADDDSFFPLYRKGIEINIVE